MLDTSTSLWYIAETKPGKILIATQQLHEQKFTTFIPLICLPVIDHTQASKARISKGRQAPITRPLFTNYLFIQINLEYQRWQGINSTRGIRKLLVGASPKIDEDGDPIEQLPIPVKQPVIDYLLKHPILYEDSGPHLHQRIKLLTPILKGETGIITKISKHAITVLLDTTRHIIQAKPSQIEQFDSRSDQGWQEGQTLHTR